MLDGCVLAAASWASRAMVAEAGVFDRAGRSFRIDQSPSSVMTPVIMLRGVTSKYRL